MTKSELIELRKLPLETKILWSVEKAKTALEFCEQENIEPIISYSGGKDSETMIDILSKINPFIKKIFVNTGLEYPEIVEHVRTRNFLVSELRPKMNFKQVLDKYGYPVVSKRVSEQIRKLRSPNMNNTHKLIREGVTSSGKKAPSYKISKCWLHLEDAPFLISEQCCDIMKKRPAKTINKNALAFIGTLASDSLDRERSYLENGCNAFNLKEKQSRILSIWTEQDILQYICENNLEICSIYGDVILEDGIYKTTGVHRTGCMFCMFGLQMEMKKNPGQPNRFQKMKITHPKQYHYCMENLGLRKVLEYMGVPYE